MDSTLVIGIAVVVIGTGVGAFMMFGQRSNPLTGPASASGTIPARPTGASSGGGSNLTPSTASPAVPATRREARASDVRVRWYQRLRSAFVLLLITVGLGMAIGAVVGAMALAVSLLLG
jgi:hypothetical protein